MLGNLCPETVEEAIAMVPTIKVHSCSVMHVALIDLTILLLVFNLSSNVLYK